MLIDDLPDPQQGGRPAQGDQHGAGETMPTVSASFDYFPDMPDADRSLVSRGKIKASQPLLPLFEFSRACAGCGETPYLKLMTQLFGDRLVIANATGCSSIYGGNLPTTPWSTDLPRKPRAGTGKVAVRGQCRVRTRHAALARCANPEGCGRAPCSSSTQG
ncbi:MAG: hypothetical protein U0992_06990 [Planctomycetaceae bacterium]